MRAMRARIALAAASALLAATGCDSPPRVSWVFEMEDPALKPQVVSIEARILRGGCQSERTLYTAMFSQGQSPPAPPSLAPGTYGLAGRAGDDACQWFAAGCVEVDIAGSDAKEVVVRLSEIRDPQFFCFGGTCNQGLCDRKETDGGTPLVPQPFAPANATFTGSSLANEIDPDHAPLRPWFRWTPVSGASRYELQVDDSCPTTDFQTCDFPSPELDEQVATTAFRSTSAMPLSSQPPVGLRYYWRVRACESGGCGPWSPVWYVDIGRTGHDFNGDGYSDVPVGERGYNGSFVEEGRLLVFYGGTAGVSITPGTEIPSPEPTSRGHFGRDVAVGDFNADGYTDLFVSAVHQGMAFGFFGSETGLSTTPAFRMEVPGGQTASRYGTRVAAGDADADGLADALVGAPRYVHEGRRTGAAFLYYRPVSNADATPLEPNETLVPLSTEGGFGYFVGFVGNTNGDRFIDFAIGAGTAASDGANTAFVYMGNVPGQPLVPPLELPHPLSQPSSGYGSAVGGAGDINQDGYADVVVGALDNVGPEPGALSQEGRAFVFHGSPAGLQTEPAAVLASPEPQAGALFGFPVTGVGDVDRNGFPDLGIGARALDGAGKAVFFPGAATGVRTTPSTVLNNPLPGATDGSFGVTLAGTGDIDADGWPDVAVGAPDQNNGAGAVYIYYGASRGLPPDPSATLLSPSPSPGNRFGQIDTKLLP